MKKCAMFVVAAVLGAPAFAQEPAAKPAQDAGSASRPSVVIPKDRRMGLAKPIVLEEGREVYGAKLAMKPSDASKLADVMKDPKSFEGKRVRVEGVVENVCQKKGCFVTLKDGNEKAQVKFKDYAFFVPFDCASRKITIEGVVQVRVVKESLRRHYAEDLGKSKEEIEKIKGDETVVTLMADAVEIGAVAKAAESRPAADKKQQ